MSGRRTEVNKHQIRWSLTKTHKDLSTRYWLLERACEPDQVPAHPGPGLIPGLNIRHRNHKVTGVALHPPS